MIQAALRVYGSLGMKEARTGINGRVHDPRHTFGRLLESAGVPFKYRKVLLGYKLDDVTAHYSGPGLLRLLEMAEKVTRSVVMPKPTFMPQNVTQSREAVQTAS